MPKLHRTAEPPTRHALDVAHESLGHASHTEAHGVQTAAKRLDGSTCTWGLPADSHISILPITKRVYGDTLTRIEVGL